MAYKEMLLERRGGVALLTLNRPERLNAMNWETWLELGQAVMEVARDDEARVLLLTGAGRGFCAGHDMLGPQEPPPPGEISPYAVLGLIAASSKPAIAAINGVAMGGGMALCLMCDIRIASEYASFAALWVKRGCNADFGCTYLLARIVGLPRALELMYTGEAIDAQEALRLGLVHQVVPHGELMTRALALAERIAKGPPLALYATKRLAHSSLAPRLLEHMALEGDCERLCLMSQDYWEGVRSFLEKREPIFQGR